MRRGPAIALALVLACAVARAQEVTPGEPVEFSLEETSGQTRTMSAVRGRVVILFYEDRDHTDVNRDFKEYLHRFILDNHLSEQTTTYAVANCGGISRSVA